MSVYQKKSFWFGVVFTMVLSLMLLACGGGGDGGGTSNGPTVSDETKNNAVAGVHAVIRSAKGLDMTTQTKMVADYMKSQGDFDYVQISDEGTIYAEFKDGEKYFVVLNRPLSLADRANLTIPASYYLKQVRMSSKLQVNIPEKKPVVLASGLDYYDPKLFDPNTPSTGATSHILDIAEMLTQNAKYQLSQTVDCTYAGLKRVKDVKPAVMYLNVHGAYGTDRAGGDVYTIPTLTPWFDPITAEMDDDRRNDRIYRVTAKFIDENGNEVESQVIGISRYFVSKYWAFAKDALIYIDGCFSGQSTSSGFRQTAINKGAGAVVGWKNVVNDATCYNTARAFFDRLTGFNNYKKLTPSQRAFPAHEVRAELLKEGFPVSKMIIDPATPTGGLLEPSIQQITVSERTYEGDDGKPADQSTMTIKGLFGSAEGHEIKVTVNDQEMGNLKINSGADGKIESLECDLPMDPGHAGFSGKVVVSIDKHKSNAVNLTLWRWTLHQTFVETKDKVSFTQNVYWDVYIRADVHPYRTEAGGDLQQPEAVDFKAAPGSKVTFTFVTIGPNGLSSSPTSGTLPYGIRTESGVIKGYIFEGKINMKEGKLTVNNFFGHPIYLTNAPKPMGLFLDPAYVSWPGVSTDKDYYMTSDYNIQSGDIAGSLSVTTTTLHYDACTPTNKPGTSVSTAGEDVNFP